MFRAHLTLKPASRKTSFNSKFFSDVSVSSLFKKLGFPWRLWVEDADVCVVGIRRWGELLGMFCVSWVTRFSPFLRGETNCMYP